MRASQRNGLSADLEFCHLKGKDFSLGTEIQSMTIRKKHKEGCPSQDHWPGGS